MSDIESKFQEYCAAVQDKDDAHSRSVSLLMEIKTIAGGSTFCVGGQHYQIRTRRDKTYLCELDGPPKGRPKKTDPPKEEKEPEKVDSEVQ